MVSCGKAVGLKFGIPFLSGWYTIAQGRRLGLGFKRGRQMCRIREEEYADLQGNGAARTRTSGAVC